MIKYSLFLIGFIVLLQGATIESKIKTNEKILKKQESVKQQTSSKIKKLAKQILAQSSELKKLEKNIEGVNKDIQKHQELLDISQKELDLLNIKSKILLKRKITSEDQLIELITEDYAATKALALANENSLEELYHSEIYSLIAKNTKDEILKIDNLYMNVAQDKISNETNINKISIYIEKRKKKKKILSQLKAKHSKSLKKLNNRHKEYQAVLKKTIKKQKSLSNLLGKLNILKSKERKKDIQRKAKEQRRLAQLKKQQKKKKVQNNSQKEVQVSNAEQIDLDVRMIGSSTKGVKISRYRGSKTIAPLKDYDVVKKFGTYYDPIYKIKLFNESVVLKSNRKKAKVYSVLNGKVVYAKMDSGMLENVVIVQHKNGLHTIYSHLDQISPTLRVGKWIKKGYVVGRVDSMLTFQATKNNSHINPQDLFK